MRSKSKSRRSRVLLGSIKENATKRRPWTPTEDEAIRKLVNENGTKQ